MPPLATFVPFVSSDAEVTYVTQAIQQPNDAEDILASLVGFDTGFIVCKKRANVASCEKVNAGHFVVDIYGP